MPEAPEPGYPTFAEAEGQFRAFASSQGLTDQVVFITSDDLLVFGRQWFVRHIDPVQSRSHARQVYDHAVACGRGVSLTGHCILNGSLSAHVYGPGDDDEAARLMYPNGLKLSVRENPPVATAVSRLRWAVLRCKSLFGSTPSVRQTDLLK